MAGSERISTDVRCWWRELLLDMMRFHSVYDENKLRIELKTEQFRVLQCWNGKCKNVPVCRPAMRKVVRATARHHMLANMGTF